MKNTFLFLLFFGGIIAEISGQGVVSGTILDEESGETLIGANVVIEGTAIGSSTDFDGKYQFEADPGIYNLVVSYIGFADKKIENVEVKDKEVTYLDISLGSGAVDLQLNVVVQAEVIERSENAILMLQRKADKIMDGLSSQEMSKYSLSNAASAISKISGASVSQGKYIYIRGLGDRYSSAQLDGLPLPSTNPYRNTPQLDLIPTSLLDNIVTSKSFSPDLPGNFTGGNVDIKTKTLPEQFFLTVGASIGFNNQNNLIDNFLSHQGGKSDYWGFDDGYRALPAIISDPSTKAVLTSDAEFRARKDADIANQVDQSIRAMKPDFTPERRSTPVDHGFNIAFGNQHRLGSMPIGYIFSASFKKSYDQLPGYLVKNWDLFDINSNELR
ncbi:MAG: carboxypeptidase-like regulatory domain-containing protein, partial [Saprospiraceae bacterium]|nr:carboxypeptidase-like regulatory domain-containing protein [Saprospiraceae bacterium]